MPCIDFLSKPRSLYIDSLSKPRQSASGIIGNCSKYFLIEILLWADLCSYSINRTMKTFLNKDFYKYSEQVKTVIKILDAL